MTLARKHQNGMEYNWGTFSQDRLAIGPGKMSRLNDLKESHEIAAKWNVSGAQMFCQLNG